MAIAALIGSTEEFSFETKDGTIWITKTDVGYMSNTVHPAKPLDGATWVDDTIVIGPIKQQWKLADNKLVCMEQELGSDGSVASTNEMVYEGTAGGFIITNTEQAQKKTFKAIYEKC